MTYKFGTALALCKDKLATRLAANDYTKSKSGNSAMSSFRLALGLLVASLVSPALALPTPTTYAINGAPTSTTGATSWNNSNASFYNKTTGSLYGNSYLFGTGSSAMTMTAWGSTGGVGGYAGTLQNGYIGNYDPAGLGITSRPGTGNTSELTSGFTDTTQNNKPNVPEHAVDNVGSYESMLFSFASSVTLDSVSIGYVGADSDATVMVYTGSGAPPSLSTRTFADLVAPGGGWQIVGNLLNMSTGSANKFSTPLTVSSKYWMVGAYMDIGGNKGSGITIGNDEFKISGIAVTPKVIPEPDSLALLGIASLGLLFRRRKGARTV